MNLTFSALMYLHAWENHLPLVNGIAFESLLRKYSLDYSVQSLGRVDAFLDELREGKKVQEATYLQDTSTQTLFYLLAFYVGEVIGRSLRSEPQWMSYEEYNEKFPGDPSDRCFETSIILHFPDNPTVRVQHFKPLMSIMERAFSEFVNKSVLFSAGMQIPPEFQKGRASELPLMPLPERVWPVDVSGWMQTAPQSDRDSLSISVPEWAATDDLRFLFENTHDLLSKGRVVWGALIQANESLFDASQLLYGGGGPAEVLYDPKGRAPREALGDVAKKLFALKGKPNDDAECAHISNYLENERIRVFGLDVPSSILSYPLKLSTTWFERNHLPLGTLTLQHFPLLISDAIPGAVLPLPCRQWPPEFIEEWVAAGKGSNTLFDLTKYTPPPELAHMHPMSIIEEGYLYLRDGVTQNFEKARRAFQLAVDSGDEDTGFRGLAKLYEEGYGVPKDLERAIAYYELAAQHGCEISAASAIDIRIRTRSVEDIVADVDLPLESISELAERYYEGNGLEKDASKAIALWNRAAQSGHIGSIYNLGCIYNNGDDFKRNGRVAMGYFQRAADLGSEDAQEFLAGRKRTLLGILEWLFRQRSS